jgi:DNA-nicking Smr family endonuclease
MDDKEPIRYPVDGILDLHMFDPSQVKDLIGDYLAECRRMKILEVRIIHGKGTGALKSTVQAVLARIQWIESFRPAGPEAGGWGATIAVLEPPDGQS